MEKDLIKTAAEQLRSMKSEIEAARNQFEIEKLAFLLVQKMVDEGSINGSTEALNKYANFKEKSLDELKITEKALELNRDLSSNDIYVKTAEELGRLSDTPTGDGSDNLTQFLLSGE